MLKLSKILFVLRQGAVAIQPGIVLVNAHLQLLEETIVLPMRWGMISLLALE